MDPTLEAERLVHDLMRIRAELRCLRYEQERVQHREDVLAGELELLRLRLQDLRRCVCGGEGG